MTNKRIILRVLKVILAITIAILCVVTSVSCNNPKKFTVSYVYYNKNNDKVSISETFDVDNIKNKETKEKGYKVADDAEFKAFIKEWESHNKGYSFEGLYTNNNKKVFDSNGFGSGEWEYGKQVLKLVGKLNNYSISYHTLLPNGATEEITHLLGDDVKKLYNIKDGVIQLPIGIPENLEYIEIDGEKYGFYGWCLKDSNNKITEIDSTICQDIQLVAMYNKAYTITMYSGEGYFKNGNTQTISVIQGKEIPDFDEPMLTGYRVCSWINMLDGTEVDLTRLYDYGKNLIITAQWELKKFTITLKGFSEAKEIQVAYGQKVKLERPDKKVGYSFAYWKNEQNGTKLDISEWTIDDNLTLVPIWKAETYTITYDANGGIADKNTETVKYDSAYTLTNATRTGYAFVGWYYNNKIESNDIWNIASDVTLKAEWKQIFNVEGNSIVSLTEYGKGLSDINVPSSIDGINIVSIGQEAFSNSTSLKNITISLGIKDIKARAFYNCDNLTSIIMPSSIETIGESAFESCKVLYNIVLPSSLKEIGNSAFEYCESITDIVIPNSITSIEDDLFSWCTALTQITIPNSVTYIGDYAFYRCVGLTSIDLPNSVKYIGRSSFSDCLYLMKIRIPSEIAYIGEGAFDYCYNLRFYYSSNNDVYYLGNENNHYVVALGMWKGLRNQQDTEIKIEEGCRIIMRTVDGLRDYANINVKKIIIPDSVVAIGDMAFFLCENIEEIEIHGNSLQIIDDYAFNFCTSLININIPNSLIYIGEGAFDGTKISSITIPAAVTHIGRYAFSGTENLKSITFEETSSWYIVQNEEKWEAREGGEEIDVRDSENNVNLLATETGQEEYYIYRK